MPFDVTPQQVEPVDILQKIREQIVAGHWTRNQIKDTDGNRCAMGWWLYYDRATAENGWSNKYWVRGLHYLGRDVITVNDFGSQSALIRYLDERIAFWQQHHKSQGARNVV